MSYLKILVDDLYVPINYLKTIENLSREKLDDKLFKKYSIYKRARQYYSNYVDKIIKDKSKNVSEIDFSEKETKKLSKFLKKTESELKIEFGKPLEDMYPYIDRKKLNEIMEN